MAGKLPDRRCDVLVERNRKERRSGAMFEAESTGSVVTRSKSSQTRQGTVCSRAGETQLNTPGRGENALIEFVRAQQEIHK